MRLATLLLVLALAACAEGGEPVKKYVTKQERRESAEALVSKTPTPLVYSYTDGELRVFDVPVLPPGDYEVENQRCFVWRDREFRTSTLSCPRPPEVFLDTPSGR